MSSILIKNAKVVTPVETISNGYVLVEDGIIVEIGSDTGDSSSFQAASRVLDAKGGVIIPGIIDIHTDAMDMEIVPRTGADIPIPVAFRELERKMSGCGFTTVFHSLHLGYDAADLQSRSRYSRREVFETVSRISAEPTLINNKIHLRFEVSGVHAYDTCLDLMEKGHIHLLSVMDHTPGQGQLSKETFFRYMASKGMTTEKAAIEYENRINQPKIEGERLERMIRCAYDNKIPIASHDDDTVEKVDFMHKLGVDICEFPINLEAGRHAKALGMHVAGGASNILRGGSLSGNLSMKEAVLEKVVNILCSDYYPPSILHSVFLLNNREGLPLHESVNLASLNPAKATRIDSFTGSLETGKHADMLLVRMLDEIPMITHTFVAGSAVFQANTKQPVAPRQSRESNRISKEQAHA
ncbi:MAG: alpha-D-ribose 1-methylphosphonate 5-triphosphate diphosphatase [Puia sp.]|nr:alpha-D-ribose 1-methylphosphonate 5-triphosphate diphosphatase [Puia sp.]